MKFREERDSLGTVKVPEDALYQAQTQRAVENFPLSGLRMPMAFIHAVAWIKQAAACANGKRGAIPQHVVAAIEKAVKAICAGEHDGQFPVDVFQTGSGTSSNMNVNEVIATLASLELENDGFTVHPNDHVNMGQSSNDVIPSAIQLSAAIALKRRLEPALHSLVDRIDKKAETLVNQVKTGRTHLMDAMPVTMAQELTCWAEQLSADIDRIKGLMDRLCTLPIGGTAVGTGVNTTVETSQAVAKELGRITSLPVRAASNPFVGISSQDMAVELSGQLKVLAVTLMKISNDLRWMNSGPLAGIGEITLEALQPGSSIMPGKVNPVIPEAVAMVSAQVIGNDTTITLAGQSGNFELNVMLPVIAYNLLQSIDLLGNASRLLGNRAIATFKVNRQNMETPLARNPILVTALNSIIGYEMAAAIAKQAYREARPVIDVACEVTGMPREKLEALLNPAGLTGNREHGD
jgi:fumarate hydratase class II